MAVAPNSPPASPSRPPPADSFSTHASIPYSAAFSSSLSQTLLHPSASDASSARSIHITPATSSPTQSTSTASANTTPITAIAFSTLPIIPPGDLPLPLSDSRRVYESAVPGVRLTHPGGWLEGGAGAAASSAREFRIALTETGLLRDVPGADGDAAAEARTDISNSNGNANADEEEAPTTYRAYLSSLISPIFPNTSPSNRSTTTTTTTTTPSASHLKTALRLAIAEETEAQLEELKRRMRAREEAVRKNEDIERRMEELEMQRRIERRVEEGWRRRGRV